jgi:hypothetical protein
MICSLSPTREKYILLHDLFLGKAYIYKEIYLKKVIWY